MSIFKKFVPALGDIENKPLTEIPGVDPDVAKKLRGHNIEKVGQLYEILLSLNSDKKQFRTWMRKKCLVIKASDIEKIYLVLMKYKEKFREQDSSLTETPRVQSASATRDARRVRISTPGNSIQADLSPNEREHNTFANNFNPNPHILAFISDKCKCIHQDFETEMLRAVLGVVQEFEKRSKERRNEPVPSTSKAPNYI